MPQDQCQCQSGTHGHEPGECKNAVTVLKFFFFLYDLTFLSTMAPQKRDEAYRG